MSVSAFSKTHCISCFLNLAVVCLRPIWWEKRPFQASKVLSIDSEPSNISCVGWSTWCCQVHCWLGLMMTMMKNIRKLDSPTNHLSRKKKAKTRTTGSKLASPKIYPLGLKSQQELLFTIHGTQLNDQSCVKISKELGQSWTNVRRSWLLVPVGFLFYAGCLVVTVGSRLVHKKRSRR